MEYEYKVTVIVPVYNAEKTLARTMNSLFRQTISQGLMEIILINDGSRDGSAQLCDRYAREHDNIRVIHQENKGVSAARNAGIRAAKGKYLLYLDSDDTISPETLKNVTDFFDLRYDEIDVVTYPIAFFHGNKMDPTHWRYTYYLTSTGVYSLERFPYISQSTINICEKNVPSILMFDESVDLGEDQLHISRSLVNKGKIGFVWEGQYNYDHHDGNSTNTLQGLHDGFERYIKVFRRNLMLAEKFPELKEYFHAMVLYDVTWRLTQGVLLPTHLQGDAYKQGMIQLMEILGQLPTQAIMQYPKLDTAHKYYLLSLKMTGRPFVCADASKLEIIDITGEVSSQKSILIVVNQLDATDKGFYMLAYIKCFAFAFTRETPRLFITLPGEKRKELSIFYSQCSYFWTKYETNRFYAFHLELPKGCPGKVKLEVSLHGNTYPTQFWYTAKLRVHPDLGCGYLIGKEYSLLCSANDMEIVATNSNAIRGAKHSYEKRLWREHKKQWAARMLMKSFKNRRVWLYCDSHDSLDNGYYQFLHDVEKKDGIHRYYVYHADNPKVVEGNFSGRAKRLLVPFGSVQHKCLMAAAEKILTAFTARACLLPFDPDTYQYYSDLFHYEVVYLQHGVMHAKLPNMYSKEKVWQADRVVVSTRFERENLLQLGYREQDILTCGMPRLDRLEERQTASADRKILFAPSWRVSLVRSEAEGQMPLQSFYQSEYYRQFSAFLQDQRLREFLEMEDLYLDVQIHPMFSCYYDSFQSACSGRIRMTRLANAGDYLVCITDFSSFMFDFLYLNKPVISFFPDHEAFRAGSHSYSDFYYPIEDGFAIYCQDGETVVDTLKQLAQNGFALPPKWAKRAEGIYFGVESTHSEALYRALMGE